MVTQTASGSRLWSSSLLALCAALHPVAASAEEPVISANARVFVLREAADVISDSRSTRVLPRASTRSILVSPMVSANVEVVSMSTTDDQTLDLEIDALRQAGAETVYQEHASGKSASRPELDACLKALRKGDMNADSKGKYLHANIKNRYSFMKL